MKIIQTWALLFMTVYSVTGQVIPVFEEPLHTPVFSNEFVRILDVQAEPGDTSLVHGHYSNYCYITLKGGDLWLDEEGKSPRYTTLPDAYIGGKYEIEKEPFVHRFANLSDDLIRFIAIEYIGPVGHISGLELEIDLEEAVVVDNNFFRASKVTLSPFSSHSIDFPGNAVIINLNQSDLQLTQKTENKPFMDWAWISANESITISNRGHEAVEIVIVFIK